MAAIQLVRSIEMTDTMPVLFTIPDQSFAGEDITLRGKGELPVAHLAAFGMTIAAAEDDGDFFVDQADE